MLPSLPSWRARAAFLTQSWKPSPHGTAPTAHSENAQSSRDSAALEDAGCGVANATPTTLFGLTALLALLRNSWGEQSSMLWYREALESARTAAQDWHHGVHPRQR